MESPRESMPPFHLDHVLSTRLLQSAIFADLIARSAAAAPDGTRVTCSIRPAAGADAYHYHRPNLEFRLRPRSVATVHHDLSEAESWLALRRFLPRYREAAVVHCLNTTQKTILAGHGITHVEVVPHGVDRTVFPVPVAPRQPSPGRLRLGVFSRRYDRGVKGEGLLEALLDHLDPARVSFLLAGRDRWRDAAMLRSRGFVAEAVEQPPYRLLGRIYERVDVLLILSAFEGGPASLPEALGGGTPVACTPVGMCPDFVRDGVNGLVLTRNPAEDGARLMTLLDHDQQELRRLQVGAFAGAAQVPSWSDVMARWHGMYRRAAMA